MLWEGRGVRREVSCALLLPPQPLSCSLRGCRDWRGLRCRLRKGLFRRAALVGRDWAAAAVRR